MKDVTKVSIIVPVYNVEKYIDKCLDSLVNQTLKDIQIIIVNDGSKDDSIKIIKEYQEKYGNKIKYLEKENGGLSDARNYGIPYAEGEYIAFLDSDDYIEKNAYEEMYNIAKKEEADMVECDFYWEYPNKRKEDIGIRYFDKKEMITNIRVVAWNKLIKREIINENKILFPKGYRYEDVEFTYKLIPHLNKVKFLEKPCIHYIQRDNSIANTQNERTKEIFDVLENVINYYKENGIYVKYKEELEYIYTRFLLCSSLLRMVKIKDKNVKSYLLDETWSKLNEKFPQWKKNKILKGKRNSKNIYMKTVNKFTYKIYCKVFEKI